MRDTSPPPARRRPAASGALRTWLIIEALVAIAVLAGLYLAYTGISPALSQANGFAAKTYCSAHFVSGRSGEDIRQQELNRPEMDAISVTEHEDRAAVTSRLDIPFADSALARMWGASVTAVYRPGLGCTVAVDTPATDLIADLSDSPDPQASAPFALSPTPLPERANRAVQTFVQSEFQREAGTRALLVWHKDRLRAEQYAEGFSAQTPLLSWSMAKSVTHALLGIAVQQGWLTLQDQNLLPHWSGDARQDIRIDDLVRMQSGLQFDETYEVGYDPVKMLYAVHSAADFASHRPLSHPIGQYWQYSSGTSNILAQIIAQAARKQSRLSPAQFARRYLFAPLGAHSFVMEQDASGGLLGSSYVWATARDWLQFGRLYLYDGVWQGKRILPQDWAGYAADPATHSGGQYGAHFWINGLDETGQRVMPNLPADTYYASGFEGQDVVIIPSMGLVVVRLGLTPAESDWDLNTHLSPLLQLLSR